MTTTSPTPATDTGTDPAEIVTDCGRRASAAAPRMAAASDHEVAQALRGMAALLAETADTVLAANATDVEAAERAGTTSALVDRLRLDPGRLDGLAQSLLDLADIATPAVDTVLEERPDGLRLIERRRPVGVIGANFEARPNVVIDVASQLIKSRNAGVLRTGGAALASATALMEAVVAPALAGAGLDPDAVVLVTDPRRECAVELVRHPDLVPLVILRGSGDTTRSLGLEAAQHGVRTLAHADGGGVLYVDRAASVELAHQMVTSSIDRLGVCNRLNLLLVERHRWDEMLPGLTALLDGHGLRVSLPPHTHALGHEWALDDGNEATVTVAPADGPADAAAIANRETSGLAAAIATADEAAARVFLDTYAGTGAFWNATTRLLDGVKLRRVPETGINVDHVPGPRGPVVFTDLCLRQYVVVPASTAIGHPE
ncbi:gamma-glutamyl-phosphate reductase [Actinomycetospora sp. NBRC 106375]|uniref:aldehyde dehydrogenase family protein n=1 Tax=Actinomycetospora sp. NBRC 106375 TaxID=3032207 RepID=UPI0024A09F89|nr:aldehyde dehydrogenase family protein [Actinomycetospora sp. NBRC 106375]GLZ47208.1 gamma-glutamyl-phosphate reductase [Actinomycetospora sp. NBRC 106375]